MEEKIYIKDRKSNSLFLNVMVIGIVAVAASACTYSVVKNSDIEVNNDEYSSGTTTSNNVTYQIESVESPVVAIAEQVTPSVVGIQVTLVSANMFGSLSESTSEGSGIVYSEDGYIITNYHVIEYAVDSSDATINILFTDGTEMEATIVGGDETSDLAVLKVEATGLTAAVIGDSDETKVGELAVAIGNPLGVQFAGSVTVGYVSALNREITTDGVTMLMIQTDAAINEGNSGGPLVNSQGEIIGINTAKIGATGVEGLGFAIPINTVMPVVEELIENGKIARPQIGISGFSISADDALKYNLVEGVYVNSVVEGGPAEIASIQAGDVVVAINGTEITTMDELNEIKNTFNIGDEITLKVYRNQEYIEVNLILNEME